jgi:hypothetical protein
MIPPVWRAIAPRLHRQRHTLLIACCVVVVGLAFVTILEVSGLRVPRLQAVFETLVFLGITTAGLLLASFAYLPVTPEERRNVLISAGQFLGSWYFSLLLLVWFWLGFMFLLAAWR